MPNPTESSTSSSATAPVHECDYCGRTVHRATAVERIQRGGTQPEVITLCADCAFGTD